MTYKIYKDVLFSIMGFSKSFYPNEFSALLYISDNIIEEIYFLPLTVSNENSAVLRLDMSPMIFSLKGSVHSHPSGYGVPSRADLHFFLGKAVNIIAYYPFGIEDYKAYTQKGEPILLEVILRMKISKNKF